MAGMALPEGVIELAKSGLKVEGGSLIKTARDGTAVASHALSAITGIRLGKIWDPLWVCVAALGVALPVVALLLDLFEIATAMMFIAGAVFEILAFAFARPSILVITVGSAEVWYKIAEGSGDASGFAATLRELVAAQREPRPSKWGQP